MELVRVEVQLTTWLVTSVYHLALQLDYFSAQNIHTEQLKYAYQTILAASFLNQ